MAGRPEADARAEVDRYLAALPDEQRVTLQHLRQTVALAAPDAVEAISYSMPAFRLGRHVLLYYAAFKDHLSLFPASGSIRDKLGPDLQDRFSGKGTIQFTPADPLSDDLIRAIVDVRRAEIAAG
jgi:uncharacterized protein YdhG (YjbR/CyaY superfamily)